MAFNVINSEQKLKDWIKRRLGDGILAVEVTELQLEDCINDALKKFTDFAYEGYVTDYVMISTVKDVDLYRMDPRIIGIFNVFAGNTNVFSMPNNTVILSDYLFQIFGITPHGVSYQMDVQQIYSVYSKFEQIQSFFRRVPNFSWNSFTNELKFHEKIDNFPTIVLEVAIRYQPNPDNDMIYDHVWIRNYALALAQLQQGKNTGKYDTTLVGGAKINYERMISDAKEAIEELDSQLQTTYGEPMGIYRL